MFARGAEYPVLFAGVTRKVGKEVKGPREELSVPEVWPRSGCRDLAICGAGSMNRERAIPRRYDIANRRLQYVVQQSAVDGSKVSGDPEVSVLVEALQGRLLTVETTLDAIADEKHRRRGAVVRTVTGVRRDAPTELGVDHHRHVVRMTPRTDLGHEITDRRVDLGEKGILITLLSRVRVEGTQVDFPYPRRHVGVDQRRDQRQLL